MVSRLDAETRPATAWLETTVSTVFRRRFSSRFCGICSCGRARSSSSTWPAPRSYTPGCPGRSGPPDPATRSRQFSAFADLVARFQESIPSIRVVKSVGAELLELGRLGLAIRAVARVNVKFGADRPAEEAARSFVNYLAEATLLALAAHELLAGRFAAPAFFRFLCIGGAVMTQIALLSSAYTSMQSTLAAATRIDELFALEPVVRDGTETLGRSSPRRRKPLPESGASTRSLHPSLRR